jgi:hypothetical protein
MGHETILATLTLFGRPKVDKENIENESENDSLRFDREYKFVENVDEKSDDSEATESTSVKDLVVLALLEFEKPVVISPKSKGDRKTRGC